MAVRGAVRRRIAGGAERQRGALVHRPGRNAGHQDAARAADRRRLALAARHGARPARRPASCDLHALPDHQSGDRRAVYRIDPVASALARSAAELGVLPERLRRAHFQSGDADRPVGALDPDRNHHHGLVHSGLRHLRYRLDRGRRSLARGTDPAVVFRLCRAARIFRAAHARPLETILGSAVGADGPDRRQLHQHSHGQTLRARH